MYEWQEELNRQAKAEKKRWDGKVITTAKQWNNNCAGAMEVPSCDMGKVWDAVRDYYDSRQWE